MYGALTETDAAWLLMLEEVCINMEGIFLL